MKYFLYNKALDFKKGCLENCSYRDGFLKVEDRNRQEGGTFISRLMDSREKETVWGRMKADIHSSGEGSVRLYLYSSESDTVLVDGSPLKLKEYLADPGIKAEKKQKELTSYLRGEILKPQDILLTHIKGRYFWFFLRLYAQGGKDPAVGTIQIYFPADSWSRYLPAVYRSRQAPDSFLERYLAVFQSLYGELEDRIRRSDEWLDPGMAREDVAKWMAGWLGVEQIERWSGDRLRRFLKEAAFLGAIRGTREGILRMVRLYTGEPAWLVEYRHLEPVLSDMEKRETWERLFGTDRSACFLMIREESVAGPGSLKALSSLLEEVRPAQVPVRIIVLESRLILGGHTYLGVNSKLEHLRPACLDGATHLSYAALKQYRQDTEERM